MVLRALHGSNDTRLFVGQREIPTKRAETTEFRPFLEQLLADYGKTRLLEVKSGGNDMSIPMLMLWPWW
ncbi:MAG: hypothetical protein ACRED0_07485 [Gammaproteobacteria bacterium]